jgi:hypothetical protein
MIPIRRLFPLVALLVALGGTSSARGQSGGIVVSGADGMTTVGMSASPQLGALMAGVGTRFTVEYANDIRFYSVPPVPGELQSLLQQARDRFVIQYANANNVYAFAYPVALFGDATPPQISNVTAVLSDTGVVKITWFTNEFASSAFEWGLQPGRYPNTVNEPQYFKLHEVNIPGLSVGQTIYYRMRNIDRSGNAVQGGEHSYVVKPPEYYVYAPIARR